MNTFQRVVPNVRFDEPTDIDTGNADHGERLLDLLDLELSGSKASQTTSQGDRLRGIEQMLTELYPLTVERIKAPTEDELAVFTFANANTRH